MNYADLMTVAKNSDSASADSEAQKQWIERGTVSDEYLREHVQRSFTDSPKGVEDAVREAIRRSKTILVK